MNITRYIATRLSMDEKGDGTQMSRPAVKIASLSMIIGLVVMLLSVAIVLGFKREVRSQIVGFGGHIQISPYTSYFVENDTKPIEVDDDFLARLTSLEGVAFAQPTVSTAGMLKSKDDFKGIVLKGVEEHYDWSFFEKNILEGAVFTDTTGGKKTASGVIISRVICDRLGIGVGDKVDIYFFKERLRVRRLTVTGIYATSFLEFDNTYILTDASVVQRINGWNANEYNNIELKIADFNALDAISDDVFMSVGNMFEDEQHVYRIETVKEIFPTIFSWLDMLDVNTIVILVLMILVSGFCMISGLLILILERRETIGVLKALGASNLFVRKVFLWQSVRLITRSMLWGNIVALLLIFIEWQWHLIPLDSASYYVDYVPVYLNLWIILLLNVSVFFVSMLMMILPTYLITRISPVEAMRAE